VNKKDTKTFLFVNICVKGRQTKRERETDPEKKKIERRERITICLNASFFDVFSHGEL
jgi:hypothetical protein